MEPLFDVALTADEVQAALCAVDVVLNTNSLTIDACDMPHFTSAKAKLEQAFTTAESMGGC